MADKGKASWKDVFSIQEPGMKKAGSTTLFRAVNPELYIRPYKSVMVVGGLAFCACLGTLAYMNWKYDKTKYYSALNEDGDLVQYEKRSKWD